MAFYSIFTSFQNGGVAQVRRPAKKIAHLLTVSLLLIAATHAHAGLFDEDFDDDGKSWQEVKTEIPPAPQATDLVSFYVSPTASMTFSIDTKSISAGSDGVVRYILVSKSQAGAENISYEGIRCQTYENKLYAFGQKDGSWSRARLSDWKQISELSGNRQHAALAKDFLCQDGMVAGKVEDIRARVRTNRPIKPGS
jgi:hypothetical protein